MRTLTLALLACTSLAAHAEQIALYPTGPAQDSAYLRFVNAGSAPLSVKAGSGSLNVPGEQASGFIAVPGNQELKGSLTRDGRQVSLAVHVAPGDYATVVVPGNGMIEVKLSETFEIPNQQKASIALFNADDQCEKAQVTLAGKDLDLFGKAPAGNPRRQEVNPGRELSVQLRCNGTDSGAAVALGSLQAGGRYSLLLVPTEKGPKLLGLKDAVGP